LNISKFEHFNISTSQHLNISTFQHLNISTYQHFKNSTIEHFNISTILHLQISSKSSPHSPANLPPLLARRSDDHLKLATVLTMETPTSEHRLTLFQNTKSKLKRSNYNPSSVVHLSNFIYIGARSIGASEHRSAGASERGASEHRSAEHRSIAIGAAEHRHRSIGASERGASERGASERGASERGASERGASEHRSIGASEEHGAWSTEHKI